MTDTIFTSDGITSMIGGFKYQLLFEAFILGERISARDFRNDMIDVIMLKVQAGEMLDPRLSQLAYENTPPSSPLRRLLVDVFGLLGSSQSIRDNSTGLPFEFLVDLATFLYDLRDSAVQDSAGSALASIECRYHSHATTAPLSCRESSNLRNLRWTPLSSEAAGKTSDSTVGDEIDRVAPIDGVDRPATGNLDGATNSGEAATTNAGAAQPTDVATPVKIKIEPVVEVYENTQNSDFSDMSTPLDALEGGAHGNPETPCPASKKRKRRMAPTVTDGEGQPRSGRPVNTGVAETVNAEGKKIAVFRINKARQKRMQGHGHTVQDSIPLDD